MSLALTVGIRRSDFELDVSLDFTSQITALFGPSGSGKTTLLHSIAGLERPSRGRIVLGDRVLFDSSSGVWVPPSGRRVGLIFQDLRLFPHRSVEANLLFGYRRGRSGQRHLAPSDVVEALEIGDLLTRRPNEISGGERQRVALGRALLAVPEILLMDEPLAALDARLRSQILPYLRWVHERMEIPIIYVSHALPEVLELTDQVVVLERGSVTGQGEVFEVLGQTQEGASSFDATSQVPVVVEWVHEEGEFIRARVGEQDLILPFAPVSPGQVGRVALRPEDVILARQKVSGVSARNCVHGVVERISPLHGRLLVHLRIGPEAVIRAELTRSALRELEVEEGVECFGLVKTSAFVWLD